MTKKWNVLFALVLILSMPRTAITAEDNLDSNILSDDAAMVDAPGDQQETTLTRGADSPLLLQGQLTKNIFRYEEHTVVKTRRVPFDVQVPYQDTETYYTDEQQCGYRDVPVCQDNRVCHMEPGQEICENHQVCRQVSDPQVCENHPSCHTVSEPPVCQNTQVCHRGPDGRQMCENHEVCRGGGSRQECENHEVCHGGESHNECENHPVCHTGPGRQECENHPVCHNESQRYCDNVRVPHTREVTRYRTETRYRDEQYTEVETVPIFVRQLALNFSIQMPDGSQLQGAESEKIYVKLAGTDDAPTVNVQIDSPIFNYKVFTAQVDGSTVKVVMTFVPKYQPEDLGDKTISEFKLISNNGQSLVQFKDEGQVTRVKTQYAIAIVDQNGQVLFQAQKDGVLNEENVRIAVTSNLPKDQDVKVVLAISRSGAPLAGLVTIRRELIQAYQLDVATFGDANKVQNFVIDGVKQGAKLVFDDLAPTELTVDTKYEMTLIHQKRFLGFNVGQKVLTTQTFNQKDLVKTGANSYSIEIAKFNNIEDHDLNRFFKKNQRVIIKLKATRSSPHLNGGLNPVSFEKFAKITVK